jgi:hypothetical protein
MILPPTLGQSTYPTFATAPAQSSAEERMSCSADPHTIHL